jgi:TP901 family phage tail tape measure protein
MPDDVTSLQIKVLSDGVKTAETRLSALERAGAKTERQMDKNSASALKMGNAFRTAGSVATSALAVVGIGVGGLTLTLGSATQAWLEYDKAIKQVNSIAGYSAKQFKDLRKDVLNLASALGVDAKEAAQGLFEIIQADIPKENALDFLQTAIQTSVGGGTTVATAVNAITNVINAYGLEANRAQEISDKLFTTVLYGKATFEGLGGALAGAMVPAAAFGVSFEEVLAMVTQITSQGTSTSESITQIERAMTSLLNPTEEMTAALRSMGFASARQAVDQLGLIGVLERLRQAYAGNDAGLVKAVGSVVAYQAVLGTTGEKLEKTRRALDEVNNASGRTEKAFKTNADVTSAAISSVKTSAVLLVEQMEASMGIIAAFGEALRGVAGLIQSLGNLSADTQNALNLGGKMGVTATLGQLEKLQEEQKKLIAGGADLAKGAKAKADWGLLPLLTNAGVANSRLIDVNKEIAALQAGLEGVADKDKAFGQITFEVNKLVEAQKKATNPVEAEGYTLKIQALREEYALLQGEVSATAKAEVTASEQKKKAMAEEDKLMAQKLKDAEATLELQKEKEAQDKKSIKSAKELATTETEKITAEKESIQALVNAGKLDAETGKKAIATLNEQIKLIDERNAKLGGGGGGGSGLDSSALRMADIEDMLPQINDVGYNSNVFEQLAKEEADLKESYDRRRKMILETTELTESEKLALLTKTESQYTNMQRQMELERQRQMVTGVADLFGNLSQIASVFGKKGAKAAKALAIVQATVKMYESATSAYASAAAIPYYGFIAAPIAAGAALAAGAANIAAIKSQDEAIAMYDKGGMIPAGTTGIVGEIGPELVRGPAMVSSRRATADATGGAEGDGSNVQVTIINNTGATVTEKRSKDGDKQMVEFIIGQAAERVAGDIKKGGTGIAKAIEGTYNFTRGRAAR